jgi:hypothetical protein
MQRELLARRARRGGRGRRRSAERRDAEDDADAAVERLQLGIEDSRHLAEQAL